MACCSCCCPSVALVGTNNLSTAVIILGIGFLLIFLSTPRYVPFVFMGAAGAGLVAVFLGMESYRLERLDDLAASGKL